MVAGNIEKATDSKAALKTLKGHIACKRETNYAGFLDIAMLKAIKLAINTLKRALQ